ncbi:MAG: iron-sulfur cluster assembly scaffold protein [Sphaerochaetaceae bacterium]|jgi:NifU-like protein|nr:iron-sulfur cluster assembly scaffold protein [Sphaerochaetaceae bacterium]MDD3164067.1 iron-sulfur cluster assembly scaffold protein [Sphaerochaetaceae bacterium]MDD4006855.1 iron-sulfur cluster assembly scaffold protein [Sphaerochaetaceae bacterium]MDD4395985.1 iron-sulfur cluster assembly scaffold protein [Sphaerochaetaceae bacterium]
MSDIKDFMVNWVYTDTVKDHFMNPRNIWRKDDQFKPDGFGEVGSLACGDQMRVGITVKDNRISDIRWLTYGCASAIASTSMMSEMVKGMTLEEAYRITPKMITDKLGGLPEHKFHCSVLGDKALRAAIDNYFDACGLPNPLKGKIAKVVCECRGVDDQQIEELVKTGKVSNLAELMELTGLGTGCGKCRAKAEAMIAEFKHIYGK